MDTKLDSAFILHASKTCSVNLLVKILQQVNFLWPITKCSIDYLQFKSDWQLSLLKGSIPYHKPFWLDSIRCRTAFTFIHHSNWFFCLMQCSIQLLQVKPDWLVESIKLPYHKVGWQEVVHWHPGFQSHRGSFPAGFLGGINNLMKKLGTNRYTEHAYSLHRLG